MPLILPPQMLYISEGCLQTILVHRSIIVKMYVLPLSDAPQSGPTVSMELIFSNGFDWVSVTRKKALGNLPSNLVS